MKFSEQWLRQSVTTPISTDDLLHTMTMAGLEVEEREPVAPAFTQVVVAEVLSVQKHPDADRLNVCQVNIGADTPLQIVCGAPNVAAGLKVPCALVGAILPGDFAIKLAKVRGVESSGMLCSAKELGLAEESAGLHVLPADAPVGTSIRAYLHLDDELITLKLTPNRADCLSIHGIARDTAALVGAPAPVWPTVTVAVSHNSSKQVDIQATEACGRYAGRMMIGVNFAAPTPAWMVQRLERSGLRSINALVDITNYVLIALGQPLHAFDADKLQGDIVVRYAKPDEQITLLNDKTVSLTPDMLVIADAQGPQALAGIMGGAASAVSDTTQNVFLESAWFDPLAIVGKSRILGFGSDSSYRFERGVDYAQTASALDYASDLILQICGGSAGPITEHITQLPERPSVIVRLSRVKRVLGLSLTGDELCGLLQRLQLQAELVDGAIKVTPPSFRFDLAIEEDIIEEVARLVGYDHLPQILPATTQPMHRVDENLRSLAVLKQFLVAKDYQEVVNYAFVDAGWEQHFGQGHTPIKLQNPLTSQMSVMRTTLLGGLVDTLSKNLKRKQARVRIFEAARVFLREAQGGYQQPEKIAGLIHGAVLAEQWGSKSRPVDFYDAKSDVEALLHPHQARYQAATDHPAFHPGRCASISMDGVIVGYVGELHPSWVQQYDLGTAPQLFELDLSVLQNRVLPKAVELAKAPAVRRDIAVIVDENVPAQALLDTLNAINAPLLKEVALFDVYSGKGIEENKKSLAFKLILQDTYKTLVDQEVEAIVAACLNSLATEHQAYLRA